ncbi:MAG: nuclear transport factor 2 family protein [Dehalococcoidales bacterium]|nr:nuclear transport factor 2 family protein [Dehalococcoidales bacterium]
MELDEITRRLQTLEDIEAIERLQHRYIYLLLNNQWQEMADCFTQDAYANIWRHGGHQGKEAIYRLFTERIAKVNPAGEKRDAHFTVMPVITVEGDKARGYWMLYIFAADPDNPGSVRYNQGLYDCEYARVNGEWKFSKLVWTNPWPLTPDSLPRPEDWQNPDR